MVAAAHPLAAAAGARLLAEGGNAFDAAVATAAALNVVEPFMSGLAGMGLATCFVASENKVRTLDFVPPIPSRFPVERLNARAQLARGPVSVGTPGNLAGWNTMLETYGSKSLKDTFAPAIALARDGFPLVEFGVYEFNDTTPEIAAHPELYPEYERVYLAGRTQVKRGDVLVQPDLAATLQALGEHGAGLLYGGSLGETVIAHLQATGGTLTMDDLRACKPEWREPMAVSYRGLTVHSLTPPCEAFQFMLTLRILEGFDLGRLDHNGVDHLDIVLRAIRLAAGIRLAGNNPAPEALARLMSDTHVETLRARVRDGRPVTGPTEQWLAPLPGDPPNHEDPNYEDPGHTTSLSVADRFGNVVCLTQSLGSPFGSGVIVPGTGLCLNNFMYWADVDPLSPNRARPGDALPMCMSPTISTVDGKPVLALGTPGSYGIMQTQAQALIHHLDFGLPLQQAIEAPRARLWDGKKVEIEGRIPAPTIAALRGRGHDIEAFENWTMKVGGMQAIRIDPATSVFTGACDPRRDGYVATP
jgi:gamma-glutamyltranspeptidase/glutathione hydrolase